MLSLTQFGFKVLIIVSVTKAHVGRDFEMSRKVLSHVVSIASV